MKMVYPNFNIDNQSAQDELHWISRLKGFMGVNEIEVYEYQKSNKECLRLIQKKISYYNWLKSCVKE